MRPFLLHKKYDDNLRKKTWNEMEIIQDLNLNFIFKAMAKNDTFLYNTAKKVVLDSLIDIDTIIYRQNILKDCINNSSVIKKSYDIASSALKAAAYYKEYTQPNYARMISVSVRVLNSVGLLELLVTKLEELRYFSRITENNLQSEGLIKYYNQQTNFLTDEFFMKVKEHIADLKLISEDSKLVIGSRIGNGMKGTSHVLRKVSNGYSKINLMKKLIKTSSSNVIPLDNTSIANSAKEIEEAGLINVLRVINQFTNSIIHFLEEFCNEIGFYVGCINLFDELSEIGVESSFPIPEELNKKDITFDGLYDLSLALIERKRLVNNNLSSNGKSLFIITGANQGGKSTFLRSIGIAQILMQCGLFVPATFFSANVCNGIFTHFTREEDIQMNSGKLDEELLRMNNIINNINQNSLVLMNEPFATTTERDGSRIARDIITALIEFNVKVILVTHLFEFSSFMYNDNLESAIFLRAERNDNGSRSFSIKIGEPLQTSFGEDLFNSVIGKSMV